MKDLEESRPRWGTFSVIAHKEIGALIPELLLYDRLVFPAPAEDDRDRWDGEDWRPDLLEVRKKELGELMHTVEWSAELRTNWSKRMLRLKKAGKECERLAYAGTPQVLAMSAWKDRIPPPIMVAAYQSEVTAEEELVMTRDPQSRPGGHELHAAIGALFERKLDFPVVMRTRAAYEKAIELAASKDFQRARRALFDWEDRRVAQSWPIEAAIKELQDRTDHHNELVRAHFGKVWTRRVWRAVRFVVPALAGEILEQQTYLALGITGTLEIIEARFPVFDKPADPLDDPGAALNLAISALYHETM